MALTFRPRRSQATPIVPDAEMFLGDETLSVPTTAGGTALAFIPNGARHVYLQPTVFPIVFRAASGSLGGAPASGAGISIPAGAGFDYTGDPALLKLIGVGGTATVYAMYFGEP